MQNSGITAALVALLSIGPSIGGAQQPAPSQDTTHAQTQAPFFTRGDAIMAAAFVGGTIAMLPLDKQLALKLQDSVKTGFLKNASRGVELIASPGAYVIGGGLYVIGRLGKWDRVADLGWHGSEAVFVAEGVTYALKGVAGRARPFLSHGNSPHDFNLMKGFTSGDYSSFPSGHTSTAFAAAAAVTNEASRWWPGKTWVVGTLMYGGATTVGLSRMYHNKHWASDVVLGAAIGTFSGRKVVQYAHGHPKNMLDRIMLRTSLAPDGHGGATLSVSLPTP
jgi:membrane-associated phospholipid phosphatase